MTMEAGTALAAARLVVGGIVTESNSESRLELEPENRETGGRVGAGRGRVVNSDGRFTPELDEVEKEEDPEAFAIRLEWSG
jgi:hypothetical protein